MSTTTAEPVRLMLALEVAEGALERLRAAPTAAPIASVVLAPKEGALLAAADVVPLIELGQQRGVAMLVQGNEEVARTVRADGVHLPCSDDPVAALEAARAWLGGRAIVGGDAGRSRDDAMALGENGADYVAFGVPAFVKSRDEAEARRLELVEWWAEIFEVPVVAWDVETPEQAAGLAAAGTDFVCLPVAAGLAPGDAGARVAAFAAAVAGVERTAGST